MSIHSIVDLIMLMTSFPASAPPIGELQDDDVGPLGRDGLQAAWPVARRAGRHLRPLEGGQGRGARLVLIVQDEDRLRPARSDRRRSHGRLLLAFVLAARLDGRRCARRAEQPEDLFLEKAHRAHLFEERFESARRRLASRPARGWRLASEPRSTLRAVEEAFGVGSSREGTVALGAFHGERGPNGRTAQYSAEIGVGAVVSY